MRMRRLRRKRAKRDAQKDHSVKNERLIDGEKSARPLVSVVCHRGHACVVVRSVSVSRMTRPQTRARTTHVLFARHGVLPVARGRRPRGVRGEDPRFTRGGPRERRAARGRSDDPDAGGGPARVRPKQARVPGPPERFAVRGDGRVRADRRRPGNDERRGSRSHIRNDNRRGSPSVVPRSRRISRDIPGTSRRRNRVAGRGVSAATRRRRLRRLESIRDRSRRLHRNV